MSDSEDEKETAPRIIPTGRNRRSAVSAEAYDPDSENHDELVVHEKNSSQLSFLEKASRQVLFLKTLGAEDQKVVVQAMFEIKVKEGDVLIRQGDDGDNFYVIEAGDFEVSIKNGSVDKVVARLKDKGFFGELSLLYNTPRSATVTARSAGTVWGLDQKTFKRIIVGSTIRRRAMFESLLSSIPMLGKLRADERTNLADALDTRQFEDGDAIIRQGESADELFFIMEGKVEIMVLDKSTKMERSVAFSGPGNYFGELALVMKSARQASVYSREGVKCAVLKIDAFERLLGPCVEVMKRNIDVYDKERASAGITAVAARRQSQK